MDVPKSLPLKRMFCPRRAELRVLGAPFSLRLDEQRGLEVTPTRIKGLAKLGRGSVPKKLAVIQGQGI